MIREAIDRILQLAKPELLDINGFQYSSQPLHRIKEFTPEALNTKTLTSIVDYIKGQVDSAEMATEDLIVHIEDYDQVSIYSELRPDMARECYISCKAQLPRIIFGQFMDAEQFIIMMQSMFSNNEDKGLILQVIGNIQDNKDVKTIGDDGVSQQVSAKVGVATLANVKVPNPVLLAPYRTFPELMQPESQFIFRMQPGAKAALFEADGGAWKIDCIQQIKSYLQEALNDVPGIKILA